MLQQTQVDRVRPYYRAWLDRWPAARDLAVAGPAGVIRAWSGLGYNRRALNLQRAARQSTEQYGSVPTDPVALRTLPGIGPYTASAVACFAGERRTTVVDTNIGRVVARLLLGEESPSNTGEVMAAAEVLLPPRKPRDWNLALMDLGAMVCRSRNPECGKCPVKDLCAWKLAGQPLRARQRTPAPRFESTARFARGRLVEALRDVSPRDECELRELLPSEHRGQVRMYLAGLEQDGLARKVGEGTWALPGNTIG